MQDIVRESLFGQAINRLSHGKHLPYPEDRPDFQIPHHFLLPHQRATTEKAAPTASSSKTITPESTLSTRVPTPQPVRTRSHDQQTLNDAHAEEAIHHALNAAKEGLEEGKDPNLVGWYSEDDPENPQ
jgi:DHA1 family multidrug resistance protein-like MFS transporter